MVKKKIYLTGIGAVGKTTLIKKLEGMQSDIMGISYSSLLENYMTRKKKISVTKQQLRRHSSKMVEPQDIVNVDQELLKLVNDYISKKHIIIDSHAVTYEDYGMRVVPFSNDVLKKLDFDILIALYADPKIILDRILKQPNGRKIISAQTIETSINLQNALLLNYGSLLNRPTFFLDLNESDDILVNWILQKINA